MDRLFGLETEYALTAIDGYGRPVDRLEVLRRMLDLARERFPTLPDHTRQGVFLPNASRFYIDAPDHPELATPEVQNPWDAVRYQRAGDRIVGELAAAAARDVPGVAAVNVVRCNVDYSGNNSTWGQHESHLHTCDPGTLPAQLLPHLVSRIIYTGAGGFDSRRASGAHFTLSPRTWYLEQAVSEHSQHDRGIYHTKRESLSRRGYHRLHIICGESLASDIGAFLKVAATALVVAMIDNGLRPGDGVRLPKPVDAMRLFAADPTCKARCAVSGGKLMRAIDIQRHYLEQAAEHAGADFMPAWTGEACRRWRAILDLLETAPRSVATTLDWAIKLALYENHSNRRGIAWQSLPAWNAVAARTRPQSAEEESSFETPAEQQALFEAPAAHPPAPAESHPPGRLETFHTVRQELFELDVRFAQLGDASIFAALEREGVLTHSTPGVDNIEHAVENTPISGRARVRGAYVSQLGRERGRKLSCDWWGVWDWDNQRSVDLRDPFTTEADWGAWLEPGSVWLPYEPPARVSRVTIRDVQARLQVADLPLRRPDIEEPIRLRHDELRRAEERHGPNHEETALACNQLGVALRQLGRAAEAEPWQRRALAIDVAVRGESHPKVPHRMNNLAMVLLMQGKLAEACDLLDRAWALKVGAHDLTSARILWTRIAVGLAGGAQYGRLIGIMKSLLSACDLRPVGEVSAHWTVVSIVDALWRRVSAPDGRFLIRLAEVLNTPADTAPLRAFTRWRTQQPLPIDMRWPEPVPDPERWEPAPGQRTHSSEGSHAAADMPF